MIRKEIEEQFYYASLKERQGLVSEVINRSYRYVWSLPKTGVTPRKAGVMDSVMSEEESRSFENAMADCFAFRIARHVIGAMKKCVPRLNPDGTISEEFYRFCRKSIARTALSREIDDPELLEIYLKQAAIIIRKTAMSRQNDNCLDAASPEASAFDLYSELFLAFWERVDWAALFPSNPVASRDLMKCRNILVDLIAREKGAFRVDRLSNEFFHLTGFAEENDLFLMSFLDFYFFTWLAHFGILTYCGKGSAVSLKTTPYGKAFLARLQTRD